MKRARSPLRVKLRSLTVSPAGRFSPPEPGIEAKEPAVACGAHPVDEFNPNRGRGKRQSHPCRNLKLGPIGACLIRACRFLCRRISPKRLVLRRFVRSLAAEKKTLHQVVWS